MNRRFFNKVMCCVPFLRLPKFQEEIVVMNLDGVPDSGGEYSYPEDIILTLSKYHVLKDFDFVDGHECGQCKLEIRGDKLVMTAYRGPNYEGYPAIKGLVGNQAGKRQMDWDLISIGICVSRNTDPRIKPIKLRNFGSFE